MQGARSLLRVTRSVTLRSAGPEPWNVTADEVETPSHSLETARFLSPVLGGDSPLLISHAPFTGRAFPAGGLSSKWPLVTLLQNEASSPSSSDSRGKRPDAAVGRLRLWGVIPVSKRQTDVHLQGSCVDTVHRRSGQWESQPRVGWTARSAGRRRSWDRVPWEGASLGCWPVTAGRPRGGRSSLAREPGGGRAVSDSQCTLLPLPSRLFRPSPQGFLQCQRRFKHRA